MNVESSDRWGRSKTKALATTRRLVGVQEAEGQALIEYTLIFVLMIIVCFAVLATLSRIIDESFFQVIRAMM